MALRLPVGDVTVLLGPTRARRCVMAQLDETTGRCASGHETAVRRVSARPTDELSARLRILDDLRGSGAAIVLVDRFTDGLSTPDRRTVLAGVAALAASGPAVLVDDVDPVAALAVADGALRADPAGGLVFEPVADLDYLAS